MRFQPFWQSLKPTRGNGFWYPETLLAMVREIRPVTLSINETDIKRTNSQGPRATSRARPAHHDSAMT
jgi:hypothetical protein